MKNTTVLIVDDDPIILATINKVLAPYYKVCAANSGARALRVASADPRPDLILLDVLMLMDGYSVLLRLKEDPVTHDIPVIFVTSMNAAEDEERGLDLGAVDYLTKPINPANLMARVKAQITLKQARDFLHDKNTCLEAEVARSMDETLIIQNVSLRALAHLAETRDPETGEHILRTQCYIQVLAKRLQGNPRFSDTITDYFIDLLTKSAPLHDIGKVGIPDHILLKPGKLTDDEWVIMKTHTELGARAIELAEKDVNRSMGFLAPSKEIAHWHHEKWDGSGYPDGLTGDDIPVSARLMAIADVFDALISKRVYKSAMSLGRAREIIAEGRGQHFDPDITDAFLNNFDDFVAIARKYQTGLGA